MEKIRDVNEGQVQVKAKCGEVRCVDMQCRECPYYQMEKVCKSIKLTDMLIEAKEVLTYLRDKATNGLTKAAYQRRLDMLKKDVKFVIPRGLYEGVDYRRVEWNDTYIHTLKDGTVINNRFKEEEEIDYED